MSQCSCWQALTLTCAHRILLPYLCSIANTHGYILPFSVSAFDSSFEGCSMPSVIWLVNSVSPPTVFGWILPLWLRNSVGWFSFRGLFVQIDWPKHTTTLVEFTNWHIMTRASAELTIYKPRTKWQWLSYFCNNQINKWKDSEMFNCFDFLHCKFNGNITTVFSVDIPLLSFEVVIYVIFTSSFSTAHNEKYQ